MKKTLVKLNPQEADGVTRRGRGMRDREILELRASLKWALGYLLWSDANGIIEKVKSGQLKRRCKFCGAGYIIDFTGRKPIEHKPACKYAAAMDLLNEREASRLMTNKKRL